MLQHAELKQKQMAIRESFPSHLGLRVHRCLSWLDCAERAGSDHDSAFIFLWISFNAAYAEEIEEAAMVSDRSAFGGFFQKMIALDMDGRIYDAVWARFSQSIRLFIDNRYVFPPFWKHHNQVKGYENWEKWFNRSRGQFTKALGDRKTQTILDMLFGRLYVLRNQLVHGGATWNSSVNRDQVRDGSRILGLLVPLFVDLMMDNPKVDWGLPYYPVVD